MYNAKKKLNSLLSLFLLITLLCAPLTGCNGAQNPDDSQNPIHTETESDSNVESSSASESTTTESQPDSEIPTTSQQPDASQVPDGSEPTESQSTESQNPSNSEQPGTSQEPTESEKPSESQQPSQSENPGNSENPGTTEDPTEPENPGTQTGTDMDTPGISLSDIPAYSDKYYIVLNNGIPHFATSTSTKAYEFYSDLDSLGRCGVAYACLGPELLPTEDRGSISSVKPTGWHTTSYSTVPGGSLWNRSHLIAFSLAGENANKKNLITGTQHMNQIEMQVFETLVLDYIKETGNHVMYRVTPFFEGNNLVATGVQMEGWSVEDNGEDICFNVFIYNVQDGIYIDYATGDSHEIETSGGDTETETPSTDSGEITQDNATYMVHKKKGKIHKITCTSVTATGESNRVFFATYEEAEAYALSVDPDLSDIECGNCHAYSEHNN